MPRTYKTTPAPLPEAPVAKRRRGRPSSGKTKITILLDPEVIEKFRAAGPGWQARLNDILKTLDV